VNSIARRFAPRIYDLAGWQLMRRDVGPPSDLDLTALSLPSDPLRDCVLLRRSSREALRARVVPPRPRSSTSFAFDLSRSAIHNVASSDGGIPDSGSSWLLPVSCWPPARLESADLGHSHHAVTIGYHVRYKTREA